MNYSNVREMHYCDEFPAIHVVYDDDGAAWFEGGPVAIVAGFAASRDAVRKLPDEHKKIIASPNSERVTGNPQTRRVTVIDLEGQGSCFTAPQNVPRFSATAF